MTTTAVPEVLAVGEQGLRSTGHDRTEVVQRHETDRYQTGRYQTGLDTPTVAPAAART